MRTRVLFYALFREAPEYRKDAYVVAHYSNGDMRYWYPGDPGFTGAKHRAIHGENTILCPHGIVKVNRRIQ